jgi:hypothetical protein
MIRRIQDELWEQVKNDDVDREDGTNCEQLARRISIPEHGFVAARM